MTRIGDITFATERFSQRREYRGRVEKRRWISETIIFYVIFQCFAGTVHEVCRELHTFCEQT